MQKMGFYEGWIYKIMASISSVPFTFKINGVLQGDLSLSRGLRQGDPIFLLFMC